MKKYIVLLALVLSGAAPVVAQIYPGDPLEVWVEHSDPNNAKTTRC